VFNKRTLGVDESMHVLFDETNYVVKHDTQDEEYELGLVRKDVSLTHSSIIAKGKVLKVNQVLELIIWEVGREQTSQEEALLNLNRISPLKPTIPELVWK